MSDQMSWRRAFGDTQTSRLIYDMAFYETLSKRADPLLQWCPAYHGTRVLAGRKHVVMEDLTHGMRRPCVVDIKVGTCTVAPDAAWPKRVSHLLKDLSTQRSRMRRQLLNRCTRRRLLCPQ